MEVTHSLEKNKMFKLLSNCVRRSELLLFYKEKALTKRLLSSKIASSNDNGSISSPKSTNYCADLVRYDLDNSIDRPLNTLLTFRQYDFENYLCTLLMKDKSRRSAFAVRALNVEVSKIASVVRNAKLVVRSLIKQKFKGFR